MGLFASLLGKKFKVKVVCSAIWVAKKSFGPECCEGEEVSAFSSI